MSWLSVSRALPILPDREFGFPRSEAVMVYEKWGKQRVARYERHDDDDPSSAGRWVSDCSERWDITESVTHWRPCFDAPTGEVPSDPLKGFFMEPEQLSQLRQVTTAMYGDGSSLTSDRRRDLANTLATLVSRLADQPTEV